MRRYIGRHEPSTGSLLDDLLPGVAQRYRYLILRGWCESLPRDVWLGAGVRATGHHGTLRIGAGSRLRAGTLLGLLSPAAVLDVGSLVFVNRDTKILAMERITIGSRTSISWNVSIIDSDMHAIGEGAATAPVAIGEHVLVGAHSVVLKGVTIGDGAVVAAGSIVNQDVPAGALVGGNPAQVLREEIAWTR